MKKKRYNKPQTITINCTTNNICTTSTYTENDGETETSDAMAKENIWGDIWADNTEENNEETTNDIWS